VPASVTQPDTHILPESWKDIKFFQIGLFKVRIRLICRPALKIRCRISHIYAERSLDLKDERLRPLLFTAAIKGKSASIPPGNGAFPIIFAKDAPELEAKLNGPSLFHLNTRFLTSHSNLVTLYIDDTRARRFFRERFAFLQRSSRTEHQRSR